MRNAYCSELDESVCVFSNELMHFGFSNNCILILHFIIQGLANPGLQLESLVFLTL